MFLKHLTHFYKKDYVTQRVIKDVAERLEKSLGKYLFQPVNKYLIKTIERQLTEEVRNIYDQVYLDLKVESQGNSNDNTIKFKITGVPFKEKGV